jgi:hypothetical protein
VAAAEAARQLGVVRLRVLGWRVWRCFGRRINLCGDFHLELQYERRAHARRGDAVDGAAQQLGQRLADCGRSERSAAQRAARQRTESIMTMRTAQRSATHC